jgi:hypothetical protein
LEIFPVSYGDLRLATYYSHEQQQVLANHFSLEEELEFFQENSENKVILAKNFFANAFKPLIVYRNRAVLVTPTNGLPLYFLLTNSYSNSKEL